MSAEDFDLLFGYIHLDTRKGNPTRPREPAPKIEKAYRQRSGFHIPGVRNPVGESTVCGSLGLDFGRSNQGHLKVISKSKGLGRSHLVSANRGPLRGPP